jgi:hypothetical protein
MSELQIVVCEQEKCRGQGKDQQFYCAKCDMELCSICRYEHMEGYSLAGLKCDMEVCYGGRNEVIGDGLGVIKVDEQLIEDGGFDEEKFMEEGHGGDLSFMKEEDMEAINLLEDMSIEQLQEFGWRYMPEDIKEIVLRAKKRSLGIKEKINYLTEVENDKCKFCGSELVQIAKNVFDCSLANKDAKEGRSVFDNCRNFNNVNNIDLVGNLKKLDDMVDKIVMDTRNIEMEHARIVAVANSKDRLVGAYNDQFTQLVIETKTIFEEEINKKLGKPIPPVRICSEMLDDFKKNLPEHYKIFKVVDVGYGLFSIGCDCDAHRELVYTIPSHLLDLAYKGANNKQPLLIEAWKRAGQIKYYDVHLQRIESVVEKQILEFFDRTRMWDNRSKPFKIDEIFQLFVAPWDGNGKRFVVNRAKKLGKDGKIDLLEHSWEFADDRYDEDHKSQSRYVGHARKLNHYRGRDDFAIHLRQDVLKEIVHLNYERKNPWSVPPQFHRAGIPKSDEERAEDLRKWSEYWDMIKSQFKDQPDLLDNGIWYDNYDGQLHFYATINNKQWKNPPYRERGSNKGLWKQGTWTYQAFPDIHSDYGVGRTIWG